MFTAISQQLAFLLSEAASQSLGAWLGHLWSEGFIHPDFVAGGCLAVLFLSGSAFKAHSSFLCYSSY